MLLRGLVMAMTYKAYIDNIQAKMGKSPEDYRRMASEKELVQYGELLKWPKTDCELGHGHANAMILYIQNPELAKKKLAADARRSNRKQI
jgi:hypothetical protein